MSEPLTYLDRDLLRFTTAGSVDDGKSTLIGRLLYDSKSIFQDQLLAIEKTSKRKGLEHIDLSLLTDGLKDEREQGITIDVAYRYFSTPKRKFIVADTPGHIQYTRNMVTGASTANATIILIDARKGVIEQTKRHAFIASLLRIPHLLVCVNKMDLVNYDEVVYQKVMEEFREIQAKLTTQDIRFIPISALVGDNVVERSKKMPWYEGATLMHTLENLPISNFNNLRDLRFPVQTVIRPHTKEHHDFRGYAGRLASGTIKVGDEVVNYPSGLASKVKTIYALDKEVDKALAGQSITIELKDDIDIGRGDILARKENHPNNTQDIDAMICWMGDAPLNLDKKYCLLFNGNEVKAVGKEIIHKVDINTYHTQEGVSALEKNDIGRLKLRLAKAIPVDSYAQNRITGSFVLVEEGSNNTVAAGMIR
jgi:sulfate adenylyltransferase subunit 1